MTLHLEYTDTFSGEANYSWVRRSVLTLPDTLSNKAIVHRAKKEFDLTGVPATTEHFGDVIAIRPHNSCTIVFVTFQN